MIRISSEQVAHHLPMNECIDSMEALFRNEASSIYSQSNRTITRIDENSLLMTMPGYSERLGRFAVKVVSEFRKNPARFNMKIQGGCIVLFDSTNSELLALIDSPALTAIRTGAVSALATKLLSREDSSQVGLIGSGEQARSILEGIGCVRSIKEAHVWSRDYSHAKSFSHEMSMKLKFPVHPAEARLDLRGKDIDILVLATNSSTPVLNWGEDVKAGMHINSIGTLPERRELDSETVRNSRIFVDTKQGVLNEAGDIIHAMKNQLVDPDHIVGDLSDVLNKKVSGRTKEDQVTLFKSVGFSLQDVYASSKLYENISREKSS